MSGLAILILAILFFWLIWPYIARWLKRKAIERAEDYMRQQMGMPPRDKKKKGGSASSAYDQRSEEFYYNRQRRNPFGHDRHGNEPLIPKEYAEDVEYTETIDYSKETHIESGEGKTKIYHESQISDVEWTEIKKSRSK